jgi:hypothetical protein
VNAYIFSVRVYFEGGPSAYAHLIYKIVFLHEKMSLPSFLNFAQVITFIPFREVIPFRELPSSRLATSGWKTYFSSI